MLEYLLRFLVGSDYSVVYAKNVGRVDHVLNLFLPFDGHGRQGAFDEPLADLAHAVVVADAASAVHHFVTGCVFNSLVHFDDAIAGEAHSTVVESEVDVDSSSRFIELGHAERSPNAIGSEPFTLCLVANSLVNLLAKVGNV